MSCWSACNHPPSRVLRLISSPCDSRVWQQTKNRQRRFKDSKTSSVCPRRQRANLESMVPPTQISNRVRAWLSSTVWLKRIVWFSRLTFKWQKERLVMLHKEKASDGNSTPFEPSHLSFCFRRHVTVVFSDLSSFEYGAELTRTACRIEEDADFHRLSLCFVEFHELLHNSSYFYSKVQSHPFHSSTVEGNCRPAGWGGQVLRIRWLVGERWKRDRGKIDLWVIFRILVPISCDANVIHFVL